jgi:hypothetical protein
VTSEVLRPSRLAVVLVACASCTLTGVGNYAVDTCPQAQPAGQLVPPPSFASFDGAAPMGAFVSGGCVEAVGPAGYLQSPCSLLDSGPSGDLAPQQPTVVPIGGGYAAAAVATTAPCTVGQLSFESVTEGGGVSPVAQAACSTTGGAALPSIAPLPGGSSALVAWYETPITSRGDPIQSCAGAAAAPLQLALASGATSLNPSVGTPKVLTSRSISVRPPAMTTLQGSSQVLVAAPDGNAVSLWALDSTLSPGAPVSVPGLAGARAVAIATDGSGNIAIVAELNCTPQTIALSIGTLGGGFGEVTNVVTATAGSAVQPTVAWIASQGHWLVSWIATTGGAHALAQRFDPGGNPVGGIIDPSAAAIAACVTSDGNLFAYEQPAGANGSFLGVSLGCAE